MAGDPSCKDIEQHLKAIIRASVESSEASQSMSKGKQKKTLQQNQRKNAERRRCNSDPKKNYNSSYKVINGHILGREIVDLDLNDMQDVDPAVISAKGASSSPEGNSKDKVTRQTESETIGKKKNDSKIVSQRRLSKSDSDATSQGAIDGCSLTRTEEPLENLHGSKRKNRKGKDQASLPLESDVMDDFEVTKNKRGNIVGMVHKDKVKELKEEYLIFLTKQNDRFPGAIFFCQLCSFHCDKDNLHRHLASEKHKSSKEFRNKEELLWNLPHPAESQSRAVTRLVNSIYEEKGLQMCEEYRQRIVDRLNSIVQEKNTEIICKFQLFGSSVSGFGLKDSDVNIDLIVTSIEELSKALQIVHEILTKEADFLDVVSDFEAKMPQICFTDRRSGLPCNISWNNTASLLTAKLLARYAALDERVHKLGVTVRHWARMCLIDRSKRGTLPAHSYAILTVYFLQQLNPPVIPVFEEVEQETADLIVLTDEKPQSDVWVSENKQSVGTLWIEFLRFYAVEFYAQKFVVSIRRSSLLTRAERKWEGKAIAIEDPEARKRNLSRSIPNQHVYRYIRQRFLDAYCYFGIPQLEKGPLFNRIPKEFYNRIRKIEKPLGKRLDKVEDSTKVKTSGEKTALPEFEGSSSSDDDFNPEDQDPELSFEDVTDAMVKMDLRTRDSLRTESESSDVVPTTLPEEEEEEEDIIERDFATVMAEEYVHEVMNSFEEKDLDYKFDLNELTHNEVPPIYCRSCQKEGHLNSDCPSEILPELIPLPKMTEAFQEALDKACQQVLDECVPKPNEQKDRFQILLELETFVQELYPDATLELFGSSCNGFGFVKSDMDICLTFKNNKTGEGLEFGTIIDKLAEHLYKHRSLTNILPIKTAKVPIVKFGHRPTKIECDISLYNTLAQHNTRMLKTYSQIDQRVQELGYTVKLFAKLCDIGDASRGSLSSYAYILMVIHFLQQRKPPVIPVLQELYEKGSQKPTVIVDGWNAWFFQDLSKLEEVWPNLGSNRESVGSLWLGFLRYYTEDFNFKERVINIKQLAPLLRFEKIWNSKSIAIEDPFDLSHNLGVGVSGSMNAYIMKAFIRGREIFGCPVSFLRRPLDFFFDPRKLNLEKPPNDHGCRICRKIGHKMKDCPNRNRRRNEEEQWMRQNQRRNEEEPTPDKHHKAKGHLKSFNDRQAAPSKKQQMIKKESGHAQKQVSDSFHPLTGAPIGYQHYADKGEKRKDESSKSNTLERASQLLIPYHLAQQPRIQFPSPPYPPDFQNLYQRNMPMPQHQPNHPIPSQAAHRVVRNQLLVQQVANHLSQGPALQQKGPQYAFLQQQKHLREQKEQQQEGQQQKGQQQQKRQQKSQHLPPQKETSLHDQLLLHLQQQQQDLNSHQQQQRICLQQQGPSFQKLEDMAKMEICNLQEKRGTHVQGTNLQPQRSDVQSQGLNFQHRGLDLKVEEPSLQQQQALNFQQGQQKKKGNNSQQQGANHQQQKGHFKDGNLKQDWPHLPKNAVQQNWPHLAMQNLPHNAAQQNALYQQHFTQPGLRMPVPLLNQDQQRHGFDESQHFACRPPMPKPFTQNNRTDDVLEFGNSRKGSWQ